VNTNWLGQVIELTVGKVAHGGVFVARHENRVIFVTGAIPGEKVIARVFEDKGGSFARAETIQVIDASGDRVPHFWKKSAIAGGAEFGHISLERQRSLKSEVLTEAFERFAKLNLETVIESIDTDPSGLGYRTRVQLHVNEFGDAGPYRERSHEVIKVKELPLAVAEIQELGLHLKNWQSVKKISIASSNTGGLQWQVDRKVQGDPMLIESVLGRTYRLSPGGFWQVHKNAAKVLSETVIDFAKASDFDKRSENLDLYSGAGLFSGALAGAFGLDFRVISTGTEDYLKRLEKLATGSTVVLDPPRSGAGNKVIAELLRLQPAAIIYVACDPVALARDLGQLVPAGYKIDNIRALDLFPHTHHFETVVSLVR
jgi:tRNA/tmRNA/rRNA uracil-C5-methylase (TrmA/RlmC/RlmD family)